MIPVLQTERLTLRGPAMADFEAFASFYASERSRFVGGPRDRQGAWRAFAANAGQWQLKGFGMWSVEERATGAYIGQIGLWYPEGWIAREVGWMITDPAAEGRGLAYEAALAARAHAYGPLGWTEAFSVIDHGNERSVALALHLDCRLERDDALPDGTPIHLYRHPSPQELA